jgi:hypothetical protein
MGEMLRRGLSVMAIYRRKRKKFPHIGFASNPEKLDVQITGILNY